MANRQDGQLVTIPLDPGSVYVMQLPAECHLVHKFWNPTTCLPASSTRR
jgi:hypothetical protein